MLNNGIFSAVRDRLHGEVAEILEQERQAADFIDRDGRTPLMHLALRWTEGDDELINLLVSAGANVNFTDYNGDNALHLACGNRNTRFIEALQAATDGLVNLHYYVENFAGKTAVDLAKENDDYPELLEVINAGRFARLTSDEFTLAVVGVGPAGAAMFISLVRRLLAEQDGGGDNISLEHMKIVLIDRHQFLGTGTPYSREQNAPTSLLNIAAEGMSIVHNDPNDFYEWLREKEAQGELADVLGTAHTIGLCAAEAHASAYYPRLTYGHYLVERVSEHIEEARARNIKVDVRSQTEVIDDLPAQGDEPRRLRLKSVEQQDGELTEIAVTNVYYATGHWVQGSDEGSQFKKSDRYISFPANVAHLEEKGLFQEDRHIAVLGSSLSAIDAVFSILLHPDIGHLEREDDGRLKRDGDGLPIYTRHEEYPNYKVTCYSRRGVLPKVRPLANMDYPLMFLTPKNLRRWQVACGYVPLDRVIEALNWEFYMAFGEEIDVLAEADPLQFEKNEDPFELVQQDLKEAREGEEIPECEPTGYVRWYQVIHALLPVIRMIYRQFTSEEREIFDRDYNSRFLWAFAPMPHTSAELLLAMHKAGALDVRRVIDMPFIVDEGIAVRSLTHQDEEEEVQHPFLIGTTGLANVFYRDTSPLTQNLLEKGAFGLRDPMAVQDVSSATQDLIDADEFDPSDPAAETRDASVFMADDGSFEILDSHGQHSPATRGVGFFLHAQLFDVQAVPSVVRYGGHVAKIYSDEYCYLYRKSQGLIASSTK